MALQQILLEKLQHADYIDVLSRLGYRKTTDTLVKRLESAALDNDLGLSNCLFDHKYSNIEFVKGLCDVLEINIDAFQSELDEILTLNYLKQWVFRSYIYIDTEFSRTNESRLNLWARSIESPQIIYLPIYIRILSLNEQIKVVRNMVKNHYVVAKGTQRLWGDIRQYMFFYDQNKHITISSTGELITNY